MGATVTEGAEFGRWTVISKGEKRGKQQRWVCRCECQRVKEVFGTSLVSGMSRSCGCLQRERARTHARSQSAEYRAWANAKYRCETPSAPAYAHYGGRGIRMCDGWRASFERFYADLGPCPAGMTLDRIDNDGPYAPGNVRWATPRVQGNNRRSNRAVVLEGEPVTVAEAARRMGVAWSTASERLSRGQR